MSSEDRKSAWVIDVPAAATIGRRDALAALGGIAAATLLPGCSTGSERAPLPRVRTERGDEMTSRMPAIYLPHGGGPWPFVDVGMPMDSLEPLRTYFQSLPDVPVVAPRALLVVSAHWEETEPTLMTAARPPMLYDYSGFPAESYELQWPAPGAPDVANEVRALLEQAGIRSADDPRRGYDHGTFVVTKVAYPEPTLPTFQLSLTRDLDSARHFALGRALAPLRDRGVFILGSGMSYHNLREFRQIMRGDPDPTEHARRFDDWLAETLLEESAVRETRLVEWAAAPSARECHPREEHLLPLMVIAGTGAEESATLPFRAPIMGAASLAAQFG